MKCLTKDFPAIPKELYKTTQLIKFDGYGHIALINFMPDMNIHINIHSPSKECFAKLKIWFDTVLRPNAKKAGYTAIICDDSGTGKPKFKKLVEDFGFKTKRILEGTLTL
jgi:hypothetical protein